ncbi:hypothetical protein [Actibacterium sp. MT2.3-13A]|uniref:hypothetical protein n=1 Tax=Actibacterium sp. MT2.3-13A TaxID=2828332 RepID=UPI001BAACAE3|nr:hypothetical protein [Actibacterium sp. MT2.3-13A]
MAFQEEHELHKRRFGRNLGLGIVLALFVALVFGLTIVKVGGERPQPAPAGAPAATEAGK